MNGRPRRGGSSVDCPLLGPVIQVVIFLEWISPMADKNGWYVVEVVHGPLADSELLKLARSAQLRLSTVVTHATKTGGQLIEARIIRDIRAILENATTETPLFA